MIAFISDRRTPKGYLNQGWPSIGGEVWVMAPDGSNPKRVTTENGPLWWQYSPAFSPDGDRIAFSRWRSTSATRPWVISSSLWVVNIDREGNPLDPEPGRTNPYPIVGVPPADSPERTVVNNTVWSPEPAVLVMDFDGNSARIVTLDRSGQRAENVAFLGGLTARSAYRFRCFVPGSSLPSPASCPGANL